MRATAIAFTDTVCGPLLPLKHALPQDGRFLWFRLHASATHSHAGPPGSRTTCGAVLGTYAHHAGSRRCHIYINMRCWFSFPGHNNPTGLARWFTQMVTHARMRIRHSWMVPPAVQFTRFRAFYPWTARLHFPAGPHASFTQPHAAPCCALLPAARFPSAPFPDPPRTPPPHRMDITARPGHPVLAYRALAHAAGHGLRGHSGSGYPPQVELARHLRALHLFTAFWFGFCARHQDAWTAFMDAAVGLVLGQQVHGDAALPHITRLPHAL